MTSVLKASKASSTKNIFSKMAKGKGKAIPESPTLVASLEEEDEEESDDEGVDEEGMERLMKALGQDGLDEYEQAQLQMLTGEGDEGWETDEAASEGEVSDSGEFDGEEDGEHGSDEEVEDSNDKKVIGGPRNDEDKEEEESNVALDDVEGSVDEDVVPRQKIEVDNKVRGGIAKSSSFRAHCNF
jgi:rRNA-processing protein EBP2